jgi:hypothetical protein
MSLDLADFNKRWLEAWSEKDVDRLLGFYAADVIYKDPQTPQGLTGHASLGAYLKGLFVDTPPMRYDPEEIWATPSGYCGRWYCVIGDDPDAAPSMRGFDLCVMDGDGKIAVNEVYVHMLATQPA